MIKKIIVILFTVCWIASCSKSGAGSSSNNSFTLDCSGAAKSFSADVNPIIQANCALSGCHASGSSNGPGALTSYQQVANNSSMIRSAVLNGIMPQGSSLSSAQKNAIICWIDGGVMNN